MTTPRKIRSRVDRIVDHGDRVYTVDLIPERPVPPFLPGQFLHLALDDYDPSGFWPESRVFSIASSPKDRGRLRIIYSVKGIYTSRMERELSPGRTVWVKLPYGEFVVDAGTDAVLLAGGTGITAFQAFIEELSPEHPRQVILLYGARRPELLLGREEIEAKAQRAGHFHAFFFAESVQPTPSPSEEGSEVLRTQQESNSTQIPSLACSAEALMRRRKGLGVGQIPSLACSAEALMRRRKGSGVGQFPSREGSGVGIFPGRVNLDVLNGCAGNQSAIYYLAGPPPMVYALRGQLEQQGVPCDRIRVDAWE